ncbi:hypothetical protein C3941_07960 [Kaistia algarum]|uniref:DUF1800 domain-containing protein n=1 Tax=Kaistia algarum TaxID=2083279 RepID=UPI000CE77A9E|nr:DUF1800 domain-containing protein [Kaistia algarum]MCX5511991.1 DUF1800 domain-containing protein [Kaistia algarum]PPE80120.1 hypothetical protein C3941_07960 [Kaistia algarum]
MSVEEAALALKRFGLGPRPGDIGRIAADPKAAVLAELDAADIVRLDDAGLPGAEEAYLAIRRDQIARQTTRRAAPEVKVPDMAAAESAGGMASTAAGDASKAAPVAVPVVGAAMMAPGGKALDDTAPRRSMVFYRSEIAARASRRLSADIGYVERLVDFWANHFALQSDKDERIRGLAGAFEREAIRPHVLGRFEDMLVAATRHPAMLLSLDNVDSTGPNSPAGLKSGNGLNENHAREILELHTVGVDGGYSQQDVTEFARVLTGWTFVRDVRRSDIGSFFFAANRHEPGGHVVMGKTYSVDPDHPKGNERQGLDVLQDLAAHPATAHHIATKLARHFVDDHPPEEIVAALAGTFRKTDGDLKAVSRALIEAPAAWGKGQKFATPQQFVNASLRATGVTLDTPRMQGVLRSLGQMTWAPVSPEGFHDDAATWLSPDGMTTRLDVADRIAQQATLSRPPEQLAEDLLGPDLSADTRQTIRRAETGRQAVALLLMSPEFQWR